MPDRVLIHCVSGHTRILADDPSSMDVITWSSDACPGFALSRARWLEEMEKLADLVVGLGCVPHLEVSVEVIAIAPPDLLALYIAGLDQIGDDPLRCAFGDPNHLRDVPKPDVGIPCDTEQHLRVVREEPPAVVTFTP
jgi:hypothetical protein